LKKRVYMKTTNKVISGIGVLATVALTIYIVRRYRKNNRVSRHEEAARSVADHGYETAHDILFPMKRRRRKIAG
jgi:hypothetical protein